MPAAFGGVCRRHPWRRRPFSRHSGTSGGRRASVLSRPRFRRHSPSFCRQPLHGRARRFSLYGQLPAVLRALWRCRRHIGRPRGIVAPFRRCRQGVLVPGRRAARHAYEPGLVAYGGSSSGRGSRRTSCHDIPYLRRVQAGTQACLGHRQAS
ncbi:hypothetical protein IMSAGC008_02376 [Muribaculaceae bacterium]|nr:hypothetical protein IMSAGC008_02376 [Muribaculaceae bacterium]